LPSLLSYSVVKEPLLLRSRRIDAEDDRSFVFTTGPASGPLTTYRNRLLFQPFTADSASLAQRRKCC